MYRYLLALALLAACGQDANNKQNEMESGAHPGHDVHANTHMEDTRSQTSPSPMRDMHQAMNAMMDSMHAYQPTGNADRDFAYLMRLHHKSAVEMAEAEIAGGSNGAMVNLARNIVQNQQAEMGRFDAFLQQPVLPGNSGYGKNAMDMMSDMGKMESGSLDHMFASMMIPHHQDGVKMAEAYLKEGKDTGLMQMARAIVRTQPKEVQQMKTWLDTAQ